MTSINPINVNTQGVGSSYGYNSKSKSEKEETKEPETASTAAQTPVAAEDDGRLSEAFCPKIKN